MHSATPFFIILILLIVTFFMAIIIPKGIRKLRALLIWFLVFFGDGMIVSTIFHAYGYVYAKINIYDEPSINAYYSGERTTTQGFPVLNQHTGYNATEDIAFKMLMNGSLDYIDYKVKSDNEAYNGKYFRFYLDNNTSKNCHMSANIDLIEFFQDEKVTYQEVNVFFNELHSNQKSEKQIFEEIKLLIQDRNDTDDYAPRRVFSYISETMKSLKEIYKDKCIARKEISEDEIAPIEILTQDPHSRPMELKPNITTVFDNLLGIEFNYGGIIKDRNTGKILADNIYIMVRYKGIMVESLIKAVGSQSRISSTRCDGGKKYHLEECNTKLITEFFRKDKR
ncbi:hypothetical protein [Campylobacter sp. RM16187]|uniref:hypothetical protein n=1 Tax=Campylobacter sp. RM16187 TaxID=1660063 RepID=UPI0021B60013|nr:hypothetical protein [Campylobacter sp. RM16187]QKG28716.1 putative membrane protein [Campylobacter sp. RM16187]